MAEVVETLYEKIKRLNELLWEDRVRRPSIDQWLDNFRGQSTSLDSERLEALFLLSKFLYFGDAQVRELLRAMFQDLVRHPLAVDARAGIADKNNFEAVHNALKDEIATSRFLGIGGAAESGARLLYDFRVANHLPIRLFANLAEIVKGELTYPDSSWADPHVRRLVFIDDFCGTGHQATQFSNHEISYLRDIARRSGVQIEVWYLTLLATTLGLEYMRKHADFDRVQTVSELDRSYRVFDRESQIYINPPSGINKNTAKQIALSYGQRLAPDRPLGYADSQLLLGFHHNVPDNTLPIISQQATNPPWNAIFPRVEKV